MLQDLHGLSSTNLEEESSDDNVQEYSLELYTNYDDQYKVNQASTFK